MWHVFPLYSEACGQADPMGGSAGRRVSTSEVRARRLSASATTAIHAGQSLVPAGLTESAADEAKLLHAACVALDDVSLWLSQHVPPPTSPTARSRLGPALLCVLPVVAIEVAIVLRPQSTMSIKPRSAADAHPLTLIGSLPFAFAIIANSLVRIRLPSSYCPRSQARPGLLASPLTARALATLAEFAFYRAEALALGLPFWADDGPRLLGLLTCLGEVLCWAHLLLQAELLGCLEDSVWTLYQVTALLQSAHPLKWVVSLPYCLSATIGGHLYRQFSRVKRPLLGAAFFWATPASVGVAPDDGVAAWAVPSLLAKPVTYALLRLATHASALGGEQMLWFGALPALVLLLVGAMRCAK